MKNFTKTFYKKQMVNILKHNFLLTLTLVASVILLALMFVIENKPFTGILFSFLAFLWVLFFYIKHRDKILGKIIILGFFLRAGLAYFQRFIAPLPDSTADAIGFERKAWEAAKAWTGGVESASLTGAYYYSRVIAFIYYFFERVPLAAQFLNVFLGTAVIFIVYKTALVLFENRKTAQIAGLITAIFPTFNLYSAILMRETIMVFFFSLSFLFFSFWLKKEGLRLICLSVAAIFISSIFHGAFFLIGLIYLFIFCFYYPRKNEWLLFKKQFFIGIALTIIYSFLFFNFFHSKIPHFPSIAYQKMENVIVSISSLEKLEETGIVPAELRESIIVPVKPVELAKVIDKAATKRARGRAAYLEDLSANNWFDILWQTPIRIVYFYCAPFIWSIKAPLDLLGLADVLLYLFLFFFFFKSLMKIRKQNKALFFALLLILIVFSVTFAWGTSNYGTSLRHRQKIVFLLILISSYSLSAINWKKFLPKFQCEK